MNGKSYCSALHEPRQHIWTSKEGANDASLGKCPFLLKTSSYVMVMIVIECYPLLWTVTDCYSLFWMAIIGYVLLLMVMDGY